MIRAVIFDMDGVLVDSEMLYLNLRYQFAKGKNPEVTLEELYPTVGRSSEGSWGIVAKAVDNGMTWQELLAEYKEKVVVTYPSMDFTEVFRKEAPDVLRKLQEKGLRLALASSNGLAIVEKILRDNGIREFFEVVVSGESFRKRSGNLYPYGCGAWNRYEGLPGGGGFHRRNNCRPSGGNAGGSRD